MTRLILIERQPDGVDSVAVQLRTEQFTISRLPFCVVPIYRQIKRVRGQVRAGLPKGMVSIASPAIVGRVVYPRSAPGVEFDVALTTQ